MDQGFDILERAHARWEAKLEAHRLKHGENGPSIFEVHPELMDEFDLINALSLAEDAIREGYDYEPLISIHAFRDSTGKMRDQPSVIL